jgi:4-hydroxy-tetrahydrodipicolinate reductase
MISVAILGASGRMGRLTKELVDSDANLKLHVAMDSSSAHQEMLGADVVIDFTNLEASEELVRFAVQSGMKVVVGTSGWSENKLAGLDKLLGENPSAAVVVVPNFSIGSMLLQRFAAQAAAHFQSIEIIEAHHAGKLDSPSGTAIRTAEQISKNRGSQPLIPGVDQDARGQVVAGVPIHSLRMDGVSAKQDVLFGADSEQLVLSHDVTSHRAYAAGILKSIEFAAGAKGLTIGLENVLG